MLHEVLDEPLRSITRSRAQHLYQAHAERPSRKTGRALSAGTHRLDLQLCRWGWALRCGYCSANPWLEVEGQGRVSRGKPQLRPSEAARFAQQAKLEADAGSEVAVAALCCLALGLRASESLNIATRDVDMGILFVEGTKTKSARRRIKLPPTVRPLLESLCARKAAHERLVPISRQALHAYVQRLCQRAGVPVVGVHSLRATHASLAVESGASVEAVAATLGHASTRVTLGHYVSADAAQNARVAAFQAYLDRSVIIPESPN